MGLTFKEIATIGVGTAHCLYARYADTGDVAPHTAQPEHPDKRKLDNLHELYIIGLIHENPAFYLHETCAKIFEATGVSVSGSTVCKVLHKNGLTRKKLTKVAFQRSVEFIEGHLWLIFYSILDILLYGWMRQALIAGTEG